MQESSANSLDFEDKIEFLKLYRSTIHTKLILRLIYEFVYYYVHMSQNKYINIDQFKFCMISFLDTLSRGSNLRDWSLAKARISPFI